MSRILLWIPMYNCERQIIRVLDQLHGKAEEWIDHVILVNNRSTDNGEAVVINYLKNNKFKMNIELLRNHENYGLGGSHKVAWQYAMDHDYDYVITLHGDDQGHIADLIPWLENGTYKNYDCLLGSRFLKDSILDGYSKFRTYGNIVFNLIFSIATLKNIQDLGAGLNMYSTKMLQDHHYMNFADDLTINYYGILALGYYKQTYKFFPLRWSEDDQVSNVKMMNQAFRTLGMVCEYVFKRKQFFTRDHRSKAVEKYAADCIYSTKEE